MKIYVVATSTLFGLLTLVHLWRIVEEPHLARDPWYLLITVATGALCAWTWSLLRRAARS